MEKEPLKMIVFYDAENVSPEKVPNIHKFLMSLGTIVEQHAYGGFLDMKNPERWDYLVKFVQMTQHNTPHNNKGEVADQYIMIDAVDFAYQNPDCAIVVVSSDNDFSKLSAKLKTRGRTIIGIGERAKCKLASSWVNSCSNFYFIEDIKNEIKVDFPQSNKKFKPRQASKQNSKDGNARPHSKSKPEVNGSRSWEDNLMSSLEKVGTENSNDRNVGAHFNLKRSVKQDNHSDVRGSFIKMVKIPGRDYYIGKYQVTQEEYLEIMEDNPSYFEGNNLPVENVSWHNAMKFCEKLTARECTAGHLPQGYKYTLPTSVQWKIACRAGTKTKYCSGDSTGDLAKVAWYRGNSGDKTHPVGTKEPNTWGIYDMHGNVWEWCLDSHPDYSFWRVLRGGSWNCSADLCESSFVGGLCPDGDRTGFCVSLSVDGNYRGNNGNLGFRIALVPEK